MMMKPDRSRKAGKEEPSGQARGEWSRIDLLNRITGRARQVFHSSWSNGSVFHSARDVFAQRHRDENGQKGRRSPEHERGGGPDEIPA